MRVVWCIAGLWVGGAVGFIAAALLAAARQGER